MKRVRKIIWLALLLAMLIFILPGLLKKDVTFHTDTKIRKPLTSVFVTMGDPSRLANWMSGFEKIKLLQGMPFCEGSKYRLTLNLDNKRFTVVEEIVKITWKQHLVVNMKTDKADMLMDLYFFQMDDFTVIKGTYTVKGNSFGMRLLLPWIKPVIRRRIAGELEEFRKMMEIRKG